jgi:hypothetical protein
MKVRVECKGYKDPGPVAIQDIPDGVAVIASLKRITGEDGVNTAVLLLKYGGSLMD